MTRLDSADIMKYNRNNGSVFNIGYHVVFIPKYRKHILCGSFKQIIEECFMMKSKQLQISIEKYKIMPDHVHIFLKCKTTDNISNIVKHLKGYSAYMVRKTFPEYKKYKHFWAKGYFAESVGHISEETVKRYIDNQLSK